MRLQLEIIQYRGKEHFLVYDNVHSENEDILGIGWTVTDAVGDFLGQLNALSFFDDDTPVYVSGADVSINTRRIFRKG